MGKVARQERSPEALARAIGLHVLREAEMTRSHNAEERAVSSLARLAGVSDEQVQAAIEGRPDDRDIAALWSALEEKERGLPMMSIAAKDPVAAITTEIDRRDIIARATRAARLVRRQPDGPGFGHPAVLNKVDIEALPAAEAREAMLLANEAGMTPSDLGISEAKAAQLAAGRAIVPSPGTGKQQPDVEPDWSLPEDDGRPVTFPPGTKLDVLARILDLLASRPNWSVLSFSDAQGLGYKFRSSWHRARSYLFEAGLSVEVSSKDRIHVCITAKGRRWLAEYRQSVRKAG